MTTSVHNNLTGADLHESKGVATALAGEVYVTDGAGSGAWAPASSVITNSAFSTGDLKPTHKTSADTTWILWVDGTIGDGSSSATVRANVDTSALFTLYWANSNCLIAGGKGATAAADFAAHKAISLPPGAGRSMGIAGSGSGLTTRAVGASVGEETHTLTLTELATGIISGGSNTITVTSQSASGSNIPVTFGNVSITAATGGTAIAPTSSTGGWGFTTSLSGSNTIAVASNNTGGGAHNNMQPSAFVNVMIKL